MSERIGRLNEVFQDVFEDDEIQITPETTAKDVDGWDSVTHVELVINVEKAFGVRFTSSELGDMKNVGDMLALLDARASA
jgi:acyl carrier protein